MRIRFTFQTPSPVFLPWHYPHLLHGFLYSALHKAQPDLATFLHNEGFSANSHRYKLLTFSWLYPRKTRAQKEGVVMTGPLHWWVSSPFPAPLEALAATLLKEGQARWGEVTVEVEKVEVEPEPSLTQPVLLETLSPITVSTGVRRGDKLLKVFLSPQDPDFERIVNDNLRRKAQVLGEKIPGKAFLRLTPKEPPHSKLVWTQGLKVRSYEGKFEARGNLRLLRIGYESGFGERNSQGFGMVRVLRERKLKEEL